MNDECKLFITEWTDEEWEYVYMHASGAKEDGLLIWFARKKLNNNEDLGKIIQSLIGILFLYINEDW